MNGILDPADASVVGELRGWLQLQATLGLEPQLCAGLLGRLGDPVAALRESGRAAAWPGARVESARLVLVRRGFVGLPLLSSMYPVGLKQLLDPAPLLCVAGDALALSRPAVAIVGARAATGYGRRVARDLGAGLAQAGWVVVSGLARGVDAAAHEGALDVDGITVAVLGCGPDRVYPAEHASLVRRIQRRGAVVSELSVGQPPKAAFFPLRNRLISGLTRLVVVVEARERSGSLVTARHAADQSRDVAAVPGPIYSPTSVGPNRLILDGSRPVSSVEDLVGWLGQGSAPGVPSGPGDELGLAEDPILAQLREQSLCRDELAERLGLSPHELAARLVGLEVSGIVAEDRNGQLHPTGKPAAKR